MNFPTYTKQWHNDVYAAIDASRRPELSVKDTRVVITGGAGGIGAATAEAFIIAGAAEVIILGRTEKTLLATKNDIESRHANATIVPLVADIADPTSTSRAFDSMASRGPIDIYINNAAYLSDVSSIRDASVTEWWNSFEVNIRGSVYALQAVLRNISPTGVIINVTSSIAHVPYAPGYSAYAVSKLGSAKLFEYVQKEHPELRVFNLQPGIIPSTSIATKAVEQSGGNSYSQQDTGESFLSIFF